MKNKKWMVAIIVTFSILINTMGVYAGERSIEEQWSKLSRTQQSKLEGLGIHTGLFNRLDEVAEGLQPIIASIEPLIYENGNFTIINENAEAVLEILSWFTDGISEQDNLIGSFQDVISDINRSSSARNKEEFAQFLQRYGLCSISQADDNRIPNAGGGGGGHKPLLPEQAKKNLEQNLVSLQEGKAKETVLQNMKQTLTNIRNIDTAFLQTYAPIWMKEVNGVIAQVQKENQAQGVMLKKNNQTVVEILASYMTEPLTSVETKNIQKAWQQSKAWLDKHVTAETFDKAIAPVAKYELGENKEAIIDHKLWEDAPAYARLELVADCVVMLLDKNTYPNSNTKITISPVEKEGYQSAVTIESTAKMHYPAKVIFSVEGENPHDYALYRLSDNGATLVGGMYDPVRGGVEAFIQISGTYALKKAPAKTYSDVPSGFWAKSEIEHLGQKGYIGGKAEGVYAPEDDITRAEFAVLMARVLSLPQTNMNHSFGDMQQGTWYYNHVMATVQAKLFNGKDNNRFDPNGKITRQEVAAVISRILVQKGYSEPKQEMTKPGIWAPGAIQLMNDQQLTTAIPGFAGNEKQNANRAEVAYILYQLLQK